MNYGSRCTAKGCRNVHYSIGFCKKHYTEVRHYGHLKNDPNSGVSDDRPKCTAIDCERPQYARDYCMKHYQRIRLYGDLDYSRRAYKKRNIEPIKDDNTIIVSKHKNGLGELDIEVKGSFVKYSDKGLFKDDSGNYWMRMHKGRFRMIDLVVRDKKANILFPSGILAHDGRVAYDRYMPKIYSTKPLRQ